MNATALPTFDIEIPLTDFNNIFANPGTAALTIQAALYTGTTTATANAPGPMGRMWRFWMILLGGVVLLGAATGLVIALAIYKAWRGTEEVAASR